MKWRGVWTFSLSFLFCLVFAGVSHSAAVGDVFPALKLPNVENGKEMDVGSYLKGEVGVVVFMQTTCSVCKMELKVLKEIFDARKDLRIVAISVDSGSSGRVLRFKEKSGLPFTFLHDPEFVKPALFGFSFTPGMVLTGRDGRIALLKGGFTPGDRVSLEKKIDELTQ